MAYEIGSIFEFDTVYGSAVREGDDRKIFLHLDQRVHPYASPHVRYTRAVGKRPVVRGQLIRMRVKESSRGLYAVEWMYMDDYEKAKTKSRRMHRQQVRRRNPRKEARRAAQR